MSRIKTLGQTAREAMSILRVFDDGPSGLIRTGIEPFDRAVGGMSPGQGLVIGLMRGLGKSSSILSAALRSSEKMGIISLEDTVDVTGSRALAWRTGIDSLDMRKRNLSADDRRAIEGAMRGLDDVDNVLIACHPGAGIDTVCGYAETMAKAGCKLLVLDYLQKIRGMRDDRRNEVASAYAQFQATCFENEAAFIVASQFTRASVPEGKFFRQATPFDRPQLSWFKESGDIENEARFAILGWRDKMDPALLHFVLEKSSVGGEGTIWCMRRDASGSLRPIAEQEEW